MCSSLRPSRSATTARTAGTRTAGTRTAGTRTTTTTGVSEHASGFPSQIANLA
jgi:hypothetical protein